ncbi:MAG TPA: hypothetical protein VK727_09035 [Steroidobacteraceae bacterium]|jgi:hypothetical protein|nr:hypothetical protein [Steroidobacteraceae bacterium]
MRLTVAVLLGLTVALAGSAPLHAQASADPAPVAQVVTAQGRYRIALVAAPHPIPLSKYFTLKLAVYDTRTPTRPLTDVKLDVSAGMTHGAGHEFMHGMESSTVVEQSNDRFVVRGMMFHMAGSWILRVRVHQGAVSDTADLTLQCCGE